MILPPLSLLVLALLVGVRSSTALAHHSTQGLYKEDEVVELVGTVKRWRFINPHPTLVIEVTGDDGAVEEWDVSYGGAAVTHLQRQGYTADTFKPGDVIIVRGFASKVETAHGLLIRGDPTNADGSPLLPAAQTP
jgi:Family of unknown function (DUF6152)